MWQWIRVVRARRGFGKVGSFIGDLEKAVLERASDDANPEKVRPSFDEVLGLHGISPGVVYDHLWTMFSVGYRDADIDIGELIRKSEEDVCGWDSSLRNIIGIFVILGLLGTLFSVADAIRLLSAEAKPDLHLFIGTLSGAFAPSLTGVLLSIVTAVGYGGVLRLRTRLRVQLRGWTIREWAPRLRPPLTRRLQEASERTLKAAGDVVEFAKDIRDRTEEWKIAVESSRTSARVIAGAMAAMSTSLQTARSTAETAMTEMNSKLDGLNKALGEWQSIGPHMIQLKDATLLAQAKQVALATQIERHSNRIASTTEQLRDNTSAGLAELRTAVTGLGTPLQAAADRIEGVAARFAADLKVTTEELNKPFNVTATKLEGIASDFADACMRTINTISSTIVEAASGFRTDNAGGWTTIEGRVSAATDRLVKSSADMSVAFNKSIDALRDAHAGELTAVKKHFETLSEQLQRNAEGVMNDLRNLGEPFRQSADKVSNAASSAATMITTASVRLEDASRKANRDIADVASYIRGDRPKEIGDRTQASSIPRGSPSSHGSGAEPTLRPPTRLDISLLDDPELKARYGSGATGASGEARAETYTYGSPRRQTNQPFESEQKRGILQSVKRWFKPTKWGR